MVKTLSKYVLADLFRLFFFLCLSGCFIACSEIDPEPEPPIPPEPEPQPSYFESVGDSKTYAPRELIEVAFDLAPGENIPLPLPDIQVRVETINYHTVDPKGNPVIASGIISYPESDYINHIILAERFTIAKATEAPSIRMCAMESALALYNCFVITPDLIGFGATENLTHPYLHAENTAQVSIDMFYAVQEYMELKEKPISNNISLIGYSQGGAAVLAVQKMIEEKDLSDIHILYTMAGSGPYDLTAMFDDLVKEDYTGYPCSIPLTVIGMDYGDDLQLDYSQILIDPLLSNYEEWIISKQYTTGNINGKIATRKVSDIMHPDMFTQEKNRELQKFYASLKKNSLIDWTPKAPITLIHGLYDDVVPYFCSESAYDSFAKRGAKVELIPIESGHKETAIPFYLAVLSRLLSINE